MRWIDPLGLDAIRVVYVGYPINFHGINIPLGHAAVIAVDPKTGFTRYYEYGRYEEFGDIGGVRRREVPNLKIGPDCKPTKESLAKLYDYISKAYGKGYPVLRTYYSDADYQKVVDYAEQVKSDPNRVPYSAPWNTCYIFCSRAVEAGRPLGEYSPTMIK